VTIRALLFDLDGTLYYQPPLRMAMAGELAVVPVVSRGVSEAKTLWRVLRAFRHLREGLRSHAAATAPLEQLQYDVAAERTGVDPVKVREIVDEWMFVRPLRYLAGVRRRGVLPAFEALGRAGLGLGVFSDYPTRSKLEALGLSRYVSVQLCATDPAVNAFKPDPRGLLLACEQLGHPPSMVAYVGDRPDVDAAAAAAAHMTCVIVGRRRHDGPYPYVPLPSFAELPQALQRLGTASLTGTPIAARDTVT
jgi:FMN phosphatase YigB (HAD superfamily)